MNYNSHLASATFTSFFLASSTQLMFYSGRSFLHLPCHPSVRNRKEIRNNKKRKSMERLLSPGGEFPSCLQNKCVSQPEKQNVLNNQKILYVSPTGDFSLIFTMSQGQKSQSGREEIQVSCSRGSLARKQVHQDRGCQCIFKFK